jgi:endogenous inhibitor of DNA gyrase (YacG/DUF329 family)
MTEFACPSCGAPVRFSSNVTVSSVCPYCQTLVVRKNVDVEAMGKMADLPQDMSPLQIGTQAFDGTIGLSLIGRVRMAWSDGFWNEWFFIRDDGQKGWLAEAQGTYALSYEHFEPLHRNTARVIDGWVTNKTSMNGIIGQHLTIDGHTFTAMDRKLADCVGCEGELPIVSPRGTRSLSFDFMSESELFATIDISNNERRVFVGRYVEWSDLRASNLKPVEGWS